MLQVTKSETIDTLTIRPLQDSADALAFKELNEEWITRYFTLEEKDRTTLNDPEGTILQKDGHILMVIEDGKRVGCVALIPVGQNVFELSKMAISPALRGRGIGRRLLEHAIAQARAVGAKSLFLGSSTKLKNAVHLYESVGFMHVRPDELPPMPYARADVYMALTL